MMLVELKGEKQYVLFSVPASTAGSSFYGWNIAFPLIFQNALSDTIHLKLLVCFTY